MVFSACEQCADCECVNEYTFTWDSDGDGLTDAEKAEIEQDEMDRTNGIYTEYEDEICDKKKDLEDEMEEWDEDRSFEQEYVDWRYVMLLEHKCSCTEQN